MDFVNRLKRIPIYVPFGWTISKNLLLETENVDVRNMSENEKFWFYYEVKYASVIFQANGFRSFDERQSIDSKLRFYEMNLFGGSQGEIGSPPIYDIAFSINDPESKVVEQQVLNDIKDIHELSELLAETMLNFSYNYQL